jgi:hypothetical protein
MPRARRKHHSDAQSGDDRLLLKKAGPQWLSLFGSLYPNRGDFILFVGNPSSKELLNKATQSFQRHTDISCQTATLPSFSPGAKTSDHWSFWKEGYPALMVTDTAPCGIPIITRLSQGR